MKIHRLFTTHNLSQIVALFFLFTLVFIVYANRVDDLDLWWHLKSGEKIVQDKRIPTEDVFSYTTVTPEYLKNVGIDKQPSFSHWDANLSQSWLGQVVFYFAFALAGLKGVGLLKSVVFVLAYCILYLAMLRRGANGIVAFFVLGLVAFIGFDFNYSRPQLFSFLLFSMLLYILADYQRGGRLFYGLPVLLMFWANLHGGFVLGVITCVVFAAGLVLQDVLLSRLSWFYTEPNKNKKIMLKAIAFSLPASLINPNGFNLFLLLPHLKKSAFSSIEEYVGPMMYEYHGYWFLLAICALCMLLRFRRLNVGDVFVVVFWGAASLTGIRAIIFFALGAAVFVAGSLTDIGVWLGERNVFAKLRARVGRGAPAGLNWMVLAVFSFVILLKTIASAEINKYAIVEHTYPAAAVDFLKQSNLPGNMLNPYNWGGYLMWYLPEYQVFIDGRCLNETAYIHYGKIMAGAKGAQQFPGNLPLWKYLLDAYGVQFILTNAVGSHGGVVPLVSALTYDPDWQLIYTDGNALIFLRNTEENRLRFKHLIMAKENNVLEEIVNECLAGIERTPATWEYYSTLGSVYLKRREMKMARAMFEKYLSMNPKNRYVLENLNFIRKMSGEKEIAAPGSPPSPHSW